MEDAGTAPPSDCAAASRVGHGGDHLLGRFRVLDQPPLDLLTECEYLLVGLRVPLSHTRDTLADRRPSLATRANDVRFPIGDSRLDGGLVDERPA
jgi:hypothetical protein